MTGFMLSGLKGFQSDYSYSRQYLFDLFFIRLLEFENFPQVKALMLNYKSTVGDPLVPFIGCTIPSDQTDACRIYNWKDNAPEIDGKNENLFIEFKGQIKQIV